MSDLFRKEALENRSRALYGDVVLKGPIKSWVLTALILILAIIAFAILFGLQVETPNGSVSLIHWLFSLA